ncbi:MAG: L-threonylcarbamoyladenylate synthase [Bryobacteraceae bacterium]|nr:L-threonylcarbamoyladenylate synthase [Bryobacteraceae bacterium]
MATRAEVERGAELLRAGRLVAFPTETVYGLGANAFDAAAVRRIFEAKGRPSTSPLIVHVDSLEMARAQVAAEWPAAAQALAERWWPGPLTLIVPKRPEIPTEVTGGLATVGIRIPAHPLALELIRAAAVPVAAPSANRFTQLSPTTAAHVREALGAAVDLILDGGPCQVGIESTVLSLAGAVPVLLRPGMVSRLEIEALIGPVHAISHPGVDGAHLSPGMHRKHYSPRTPLTIGGPVDSRAAWVYRKDSNASAGREVRLPEDSAGYAQALYRTLHMLDAEGWDQIVVEEIPDSPDWTGLRDRLQRAVKKPDTA